MERKKNNCAARHERRCLRLLIAGGGTGGHVYPAIAIAQKVRACRPDAEILFVGTRDRLEARAVPRSGFSLAFITVKGLAATRPALQRLGALLWLASGVPLWQSILLLARFRPHVVVGTGGFVCGPVLLAARLLRVPSLAVELNEIPGLTTRITARFVSAAAVVSEACRGRYIRLLGRKAPRVRVEVVGTPLRQEIISARREDAARALGLDPSRLTLLVFGGSIGSLPVNKAFGQALGILARRPGMGEVEIVHITGRGNAPCLTAAQADELGLRYHPFEYRDDMHNALAAADMVVSRAGGSTLAEITARSLAAIIVPWSGAAERHQELNAAHLETAGAALVIRDSELTPQRLADAIWLLLSDTAAREQLARQSLMMSKRDAADAVVRMIEDLAGD
jgi:UDP-N-acetylglucosamine--N-acetylmuramyl-(pentapeptide) pyrophosphoryl-undecaprenol N-acetylglucosamine transferase